MKIIISITAIFLCSVSVFSQTVTTDRDIQIWNDTSVSIPLIKTKDKDGKGFEKLSFSINGLLRFGRNVSRPVDERIGVGFNYRINRYISLVPDIVYRGTQPFKGRSDYETRFRFAVVLENKWKNFSIADRNQIEYRLRNSRQDSVRYRNRFRFNYPLIKAKKEFFTPFVSDEVFYDFQVKAWTRNEFFVGIGKKFNNNFSTDIYYLFAKDISLPRTVNGIGVSLKLKVD
jgi:hypothetical protein